jgi:hypothetical protein
MHKLLDHAAQDIATGDLPSAGVTVLEDDLDPAFATDEGRAMLQLVHDIAPGAALGFATGFPGQLNFANNILALWQSFHADIIVDDLRYPDEPMYSDGAQTVDTVAASGAAYFASGGNSGIEAYEAVYQPVPFDIAKRQLAAAGSNVKLDQIPPAIRPKSLHLFGSEADGDRPSVVQRLTSFIENEVVLQWDEPFLLGKVRTDFNIYVFDSSGNWIDPNDPNTPVFYSTDNNLETDEPFEFALLPPLPGDMEGDLNATDFQIVIGKMNDGPAQHIKYVVDDGLGISQREGAPSAWGHSAAQGGQSVAAVYYAIPNTPEEFSSGGPVTIYLDANGNRLPRPETRQVPQLTAADGVDTTFFGSFFGTSAAAPNAAATAALVLEAAGGSGSLPPSEVYRLLASTATAIPVSETHGQSEARLGPIGFSAVGDFTRWNRYFGFEADGKDYAVRSIAIDLGPTGLNWFNIDRFTLGPSDGPSSADISLAVSPDSSVFTLAFAPGRFRAGQSPLFGMSAFFPAEGFATVDADLFAGGKISAVLESGVKLSGPIATATEQAINGFTGAGLVNADAAVRAVQQQQRRPHSVTADAQ